jgi:hypothetical protein
VRGDKKVGNKKNVNKHKKRKRNFHMVYLEHLSLPLIPTHLFKRRSSHLLKLKSEVGRFSIISRSVISDYLNGMCLFGFGCGTVWAVVTIASTIEASDV